MRLAGFSLLVCAAFAWVPPFLDRPGTALLGLGCALLAVGRGSLVPRPAPPRPKAPPFLGPNARLEDVPAALRERIEAYGLHPSEPGE